MPLGPATPDDSSPSPLRVRAGLAEVAAGAAEHQPTRRLLRMAKWGLLVVAIVITVLVIAIMVLRGQTPGWIDGLRRTPEAVYASRAEAIERGAWAEFSRVRPMREHAGILKSEPWQVSLAAIDAEAWLTHRLDATTQIAATWNLTSAQRIAKDVRSWRVAAFEQGATPLGGGVMVGMQSASQRWTWIQAKVRSEIAPANQQGTITPLVSLVNAGQGNVKVPLGLIAMMGSAQDLTRAAEVLRDDGFWRVKLPDGREVRLLAISVQSDPQGGRLTLTCETVLEHTPK